MSEVPGPGSYTSRSELGGPLFSLRGKFYKQQPAGTPGPGHYVQPKSASLYASAPAFNFPKEKRSGERMSEAGGPGLYYVPPKPIPPLWSFGSEQRSKSLKNSSPGPGQYTIKASVPDVPAYS